MKGFSFPIELTWCLGQIFIDYIYMGLFFSSLLFSTYMLVQISHCQDYYCLIINQVSVIPLTLFFVFQDCSDYCRSFAISYKFWKLFLNFFENSSCDLDRLYNLQSLKLYRLYKLSSLWRTDILTMSFPIHEQGIALHSLRSFISPSNIL